MRSIMKSVRILVLAAALWATATLTPAIAALPAPSLGSLSMRVQLSDSVVLVSGQLTVDASVPATIALPVPTGVTPYWVGEILGGDSSADPTAQYVVKKAKGYDLIVFTLRQGRSGQVEYRIPALTPGIPVAVAYSLPITTRVSGATLSISVPVGSTVTSSTGGTLTGSGSTGQSVSRAVTSPKVGSKVSASVAFTPAGVTAPGAAGSSSAPLSAPAGAADGLVLPMWIMVFVLGGLFARDVYKRRTAVAPEPEPAPARKRARTSEPADEPAPAPARGRASAAKSAGTAAEAGPVEDAGEQWSGFDDADAPPAPTPHAGSSAPRARSTKKS